MKVAVIGAGWLGYRLCRSLQDQGMTVVTSTRTIEKANKLNAEGMETHVFQLGQSLPEALQRCDVYIINIGAGRQRFDREVFQEQIQNLCHQCLHDDDQTRMVFVSTTSVYGEANEVFTERSRPHPLSDSARAHVHIENFLRSEYTGRATILRLAGLVAEDRHPVYYLEGKKNITAAHKKVNLVHREDAIAAIEAILRKQSWGYQYHLCATEHPSRREYYTKAAEVLELVTPQFLDNTELPPTGKHIDPSETLKQLGLTLRYASPYDMLPEIPDVESD